jgi:hypothetical protein
MKKIGNKAGLMSFLDELVAEDSSRFKPLQDDEFTLRQYMEAINQTGVSISDVTAERRLKKLVQDGVLESRIGRANNRSAIIYRQKA